VAHLKTDISDCQKLVQKFVIMFSTKGDSLNIGYMYRIFESGILEITVFSGSKSASTSAARAPNKPGYGIRECRSFRKSSRCFSLKNSLSGKGHNHYSDF
jgi:hypothetical protein